MDPTTLDGNAAGGLLAEIFTAEMTVALATCAGCGSTNPVGKLHAYLHAPGLVLRCLSCGTVQVRIVCAPGRAWLDFSGLRCLQVDLANGNDRSSDL